MGGASDVALERAARYADGWISGGGPPEQFHERRERLEAAWSAAGREGRPRTMALAYYALGDGAREVADRYLNDYYGFLGDEYAGMIAGSAATDAETVRSYVDGYAQAGCDELVLFPSNPDPEQVDLLADAVR
jgi:alkanesulfonate monooxygenase SsuD/methylene tetrahydromethanopterin reductase-like flavin-dependent oxidoreductase (luciferase family)